MALAVVVAVVVGVTVLVLSGRDSGSSSGSPGVVVPVMSTVPTVVILDASGSMTIADAPGPRIDAAKAAAQGLVDALPDDATVGLMTYGTGTGSTEAEQAAGCQDVTTLIPLGRLDRGAMGQRIAGLTPSGYTPISLALQRATDQLPGDGSAQAIVLVSDGEDTCNTPPCDTAAQLKRAHPGLTVSTVGFRTDGPASDQLSCVARATGGLFVGAANAGQLAARLIAVQNVDEAKKALTAEGVDDIRLGQSLEDIRKAHSDFPDGSRSGTVVVVWRDCDFGFVDGVLDSIAPRDGGRTIDGVARGTELSRVTELYGDPVQVDADQRIVVYQADGGNADSDAGYRIDVDGFRQSGQSVTGTVKTITLCRCKPHDAGKWTDPVVIVTPNSVGAARLGMSNEEIEAAAGIRLTLSCTQCDAVPTADLGPQYPWYSSISDASGSYFEMRVGLRVAEQPSGQVVKTAEGFPLGGTVDELRRIYGDRIQPYESLGMISYRGYVLAGAGGYLIFDAIDRNGLEVTNFVLRQQI